MKIAAITLALVLLVTGGLTASPLPPGESGGVIDDPQPSPSYDIVDLGDLGGGWSIPSDIDENGTVVGSSFDERNTLHAFRADCGKEMLKLEPAKGQAYGVSDMITVGQYLEPEHRVQKNGYFITIPTRLSACYWIGDEFVSMYDDGIGYSEGRGVNKNGLIVGIASKRVGDTILSRPALWDGKRVVDLAGRLEGAGWANDVNDRNQVVWTIECQGRQISFMSNLEYSTNLGSGYATGINNQNDVVGYDMTPTQRVTPWYWSKQTGRYNLATLAPGMAAWPYDINDGGMAVGIAEDENGWNMAALWNYQGVHNLGEMTRNGSHWWLFAAYDINNSGQIAAGGYNMRTGEVHALRLEPIFSVL